jgi:hypothetical protein
MHLYKLGYKMATSLFLKTVSAGFQVIGPEP